jgi:hypothetical protein
VVGVVVGELKLTAPGIIIRFGFDYTCRVGNDRRGLQMVREVIEDAACAVDSVAAGNALAVKENVFALGCFCEIGFGGG